MGECRVMLLRQVHQVKIKILHSNIRSCLGEYKRLKDISLGMKSVLFNRNDKKCKPIGNFLRKYVLKLHNLMLIESKNYCHISICFYVTTSGNFLNDLSLIKNFILLILIGCIF